MTNIEEMRLLIEQLNRYRNEYYNNNNSLVSDSVYDSLFDKLKALEEETGVIYPNSPTVTVGYTVQSKLKKVQHSHPMLSLDKTKDLNKIIKFLNGKLGVAMLKMDGLTCSLHYNSAGELVSAETRGNGEIGEDVTANVKTICNVPLFIDNDGVELTVDGEVIVTKDVFNAINEELDEDNKYSHPRNLASGSVRQLDSSIAATRNMKFVAWKMIEGMTDENEVKSFTCRLDRLKELGFEIVPYSIIWKNPEIINLEPLVEALQVKAEEKNYPIDGLVFGFDNIAYGDSLGRTSHHLLSQIAFKFEDEGVHTILRDVEWNVGKSGMVAPTAIFDEVDLDGALTTRATLHNLSIMKELEIGIGDEITIIRANQVIPKVEDNITRSGTYEYPTTCPCCGSILTLKTDTGRETLYCENNNCSAKVLSKFSHFVSKNAMNIDGLSEATLERFIKNGYIKSYRDIYHLSDYADEIQALEGFGKKSYDKLVKSIENSRNVKLENYLVALGIPLIGRSASKTISKFFGGNYDKFVEAAECGMDFSDLEDFGLTMNESIQTWGETHWRNPEKQLEYMLAQEMNFVIEEDVIIANDFISGKTFCVTGAFNTMKRSEIEKIIAARGGKLSSSVSKKTDYLLTNDAGSGSSKATKAKELNVAIMNEAEFIEKIK